MAVGLLYHDGGSRWRPFEEARAYVRGLGLKSQAAWHVWRKTGERPPDIPSAPERVYKDHGWISYGNWLGTGTIANQDRTFRPFEEARAYVRGLGLRNGDEWADWAKSAARPAAIPSAPDRTYKDQWIGMSDWLGVVNHWRRKEILAFLQDLLPRLSGLSPMVLFEILRRNGMLAASEHASNGNKQLLADLVRLSTVGDPAALAAHIADTLTPLAATDAEIGGTVAADDSAAPTAAPDDALADGVIPPHEEGAALDAGALPSLDPPALLAAVDYATLVCPGADEEAIAFIIADAVGRLWHEQLRAEGALDLDALLRYPAGEYAERVRQQFLEQLQGAQDLPIPPGYQFRLNGHIAPPNLMQRLIAYRLKEEQRLGNWSGAGAGKTLGAILASRVVDAHLIVIVGLNNTLHGWRDEILCAFPNSRVLVKEREGWEIDARGHTYLLLNFEAFQQPDAPSMVRRLVEDYQIDMIVLDEIHSAKQRDAVASKRRQILLAFLSLASEKNPQLHVLGMSATPVVNTLAEARSLLEMVQGVEFPELETWPSIPNVVALHQKLVLHGVRYRPRYEVVLEEHPIPVAGEHLLPQLRGVGADDVLTIERILLEAKLDTIVAQTTPGTLIYSHYVEGIVPRVREALADAGFSVATFTGADKTGWDLFLRRKVDVLIGSDTLKAGMNGLQKVCNRLIVATLPWTGADYEQPVGRIYRQGSVFAHVDVIIPQVVIGTEGEEWSWDVQRHDRICYKKTLADAAVDGVIPEGILESRQALLGRSLEALRGWIARIEQEGPAPSIERALLHVPLPAEEMRRAVHRWGDFSEMNRRWVTSRTTTTHERLQDDPTEWFAYHTLYHEARKDWPEVPYETFAQWLRARPHLIVGDFGCGEAQLAAALPNTVYSFDHVAINEGVTACDMAHTPLEDGVLDVAVFSLSLMGVTWQDYLKEAHRVLKLDGRLRVAETASRWEGDKRAELLDMIGALGFGLIGTVEERDRFLYIDALKG